MRFFLPFMSTTIFAFAALAQGDFAQQIMSSGRYEVKKSSVVHKAQTKVRRPASENDVTVELKATAGDAKASTVIEAANAPVVTSTATAAPAAPKGPVTDVSEPAPAIEPVEPTLSEQTKALFGSDYGKIREFYQEQIHPDDPRLNRVEIQLVPGLAYNDSKSNYSYRSYQMNYGEMDIQANVWATPLMGITGGLRSSFGASLRGDSATNSMLPVKNEEMNFGLKFRRFDGLSRKSNSTEFSLLYSETTLSLPVDSTARSRLKSSGVGLGLSLKMPTSAQHAWIFGGQFFPRLQHTETKSALDLSSGSSAENFRLGLDLGGEFRMSRESQLVYDMGWSMEKNLFDGPAAAVDAESGVTPSNVTVTNTLLKFSFGYRWGH